MHGFPTRGQFVSVLLPRATTSPVGIAKICATNGRRIRARGNMTSSFAFGDYGPWTTLETEREVGINLEELNMHVVPDERGSLTSCTPQIWR